MNTLIKRDLTDYMDLTVGDKIDALDNKYQYLDYVLDTINNMDIKNFNFIIFEEDIDNMSIYEFEEYFSTIFMQEIIPSISNFLNIDTEYMTHNDISSRRLYLKNIIRFFTTIMPYNFLKQYLVTQEIENMYDALDKINSTIRTDLLKSSNNTQTEYDNFLKLMHNVKGSIVSDKKKDRFDTMLNILDNNMSDKVKYNDYYISIISTSSTDSIIELCKLYIKNDYTNLV